jgi:hypothetical protein
VIGDRSNDEDNRFGLTNQDGFRDPIADYRLPITDCPSMRYTLFVLLTLLLTAGIGWVTYQAARLLRVWRPDSNMLLAPAENALRLGLVLLCIGLGLLSGLPPAVLGWTWAGAGAAIAWGTIVGVLLSLALTGASMLALRRWGQAIYSPLVILNILPASRREWLLVLVALFPAVLLEELLFRSLLLGGLSPLAPAWLLAILVSLVFGFLHAPQGALGVAGTALAGLVFSWLFVWQGTLLAPLAAHYTANVLQLVQAGRNRDLLAAMQHSSVRAEENLLPPASDSDTMNTPDDQERAAKRAKQIARGRWLTLVVVVVALGGPLMELVYRLT